MNIQIRISSKILLLFIPFILLNIVYTNSTTWKNKYGMNKYDSIPENIEIANLGSSHGFHSFNYNIEGFSNKTCFNFAIGQQTLDFDCGLLKQYIGRFKENSTLIICLSPFETDGIPDYKANRDSQFRYYGMLEKQNFDTFSRQDWFFFNYLALVTSKHPVRDIRDSLAELMASNKNGSISPEVLPQASVLTDDINYERVPLEERQQQAEEIVDVWTNFFPPDSKGKEHNLRYLDQMIRLCREHKINTVVVTTPISREVYDVLRSRPPYYDLEKFYGELAEKYPETKFLNYIDLFFGKDRLFRDNNHLSPEGAIEFSKIIQSDIIRFGFINQE